MNLDSCKEGQRLTITTFDRPLMVAAGAGSGKTFTLTRRIAYGLLAGEGKSGGLRSVDEVLAITFTVKAAAELRDRIRGLLREEGLVEESLKVDDAWVCTIGSMAARILRENAFEVGIDPKFEVIDEAEASYLRAEATEQVLAHLEAGADPLLRAVIDEFGLRGQGPFDKRLLEHSQEVVARVRAMPEGFGGLRVAEPTAAPAKDAVKSTVYHAMGGKPLAQMETLHAQNHDLVAWISIDNVLDLPVVYRNNSYYLTHDFNKNKSTAGTIFLDENHPMTERTQNLLLHGHNMKDGTMFGRLAQYEKNLEYLKAHAFIDFSTLWHQERYVVFAVLDVSLDIGDDRFVEYFAHPTFKSDEEFERYIRRVELASLYAIPMDVKPTDALLTLSTCLDEDRLVILARRQREGEKTASLREIVNMAVRQ